MAQDSQINNLSGGLNVDYDLASMPDHNYPHASDVEFVSDEEFAKTVKNSKAGTLEIVKVPNATAQLQIWKIRTYADNAQTSTDYFAKQEFFLDYLDGTAPLVITYINGNPSITNAGYATALTALLVTPYAGIVADNGNNNLLYTTLTFTTTNVKKITQIIEFSSGISVTVNPILIQEKITTETELEPLAYVNSQNLGFILSVSADNSITELGVVDEDNDFTYTRLLRTKNFILSKTEPIKFIVEQQNDGVYALYFTDNTIKDKCIYVPQALTQDCCLTYSPTNIQTAGKGIYNLAQTDTQTNSQLINNIGYVRYKNTLQSGGGLLTGGKRYACRFGINGSNITTQWSILSNIVPVIDASADSGLAWVSVQGTPSGTATSKQNIVTIKNAQADIFNFVELAVLNYAAENASSAELVGRFDVLGEEFDIIHSGLELTQLLDVTSFIEAEPVLLKVRDIETKKNRLNRANTITANEDAKWQTIAENAVVATERFDVKNTGILPQTTGNQRFLGTLLYEGTSFIQATNDNRKQVLPLNSQTLSPPVTASPYNPTTGTYTVTSLDAPVLQFNFTAYGTVNDLAPTNPNEETRFNMYFVVFKAGKEVGSILMGEKSGIDFLATKDFTITTNSTIAVNVTSGDVLEFKIQLYSSRSSTKFTTTQTGISLRINGVDNKGALQFLGTQVGEYQIPFNVANKTGYMLYEYYMTYVRFHLKNGYITAPYPLGKYKIDSVNYKRGLVQILPISPKTPFTDTSGVTDTRKVYNYALNVSNLDITNVKDELLGVSFERSDPLNTVIGSGIYHNARAVDGDVYTSGYGNLSGNLGSASNLRKFGLFISNDLDNKPIKFSDGDYLKLEGIPMVLGYNDSYKSGNDKNGIIAELLGSVYNNPNDAILQGGVFPIEDSSSIDFNSVGDVIYNTGADLYYKPSTSTLNNAYTNAKAIAVTTTYKVGVNNNGATTFDNNTFIAFYIRPIDLTTIDYKNYKPIPTGEIVRITSATTDVLPAQTVYGGDTYTQKVIRKAADWYQDPVYNYTLSMAITFYAQNRLNSQLFYTDNTSPKATWNLQGSKSFYQYLFPFTSQSELVDEQHNFDKSYIGANLVNRISPYNPRLPYPTSNPTRIYYSDEKAVGSLYDAYRKVKALNFVDLELQNGAITAIFDIRDVMVVIQPNFVGAIPYAADTMIQSDNTAKILVGSGGVYSNRVYPLSSFGTEIRTATLKGFNVNGNPQVYWLSKDFTNINRYDYSGVKILTDQNNMRTFTKNNVAHIKNEFDVNLYYDSNKSDVVVTARANAIYPNWVSGQAYVIGDTVSFGAAGHYPAGDFEEIPAIYVCKANVTNTINPLQDPTHWGLKLFTNNAYYNHWCLIFNEAQDNFTTFLSVLQKRYFTHNKRIFTPRGINEYGRIYEINVGEPLQFFEQGGVWKQGEFQLDIVINKNAIFKRFLTLTFENGSNAIIDANVTVETDTMASTCSEHELRTNITYYPIQPDGDDVLFGTYLLVKIRSTELVKIRTISGIFNNIQLRR